MFVGIGNGKKMKTSKLTKRVSRSNDRTAHAKHSKARVKSNNALSSSQTLKHSRTKKRQPEKKIRNDR